MENKNLDSNSPTPFDDLIAKAELDDIKKETQQADNINSIGNIDDLDDIDFGIPAQLDVLPSSKDTSFDLDSKINLDLGSDFKDELKAELNSELHGNSEEIGLFGVQNNSTQQQNEQKEADINVNTIKESNINKSCNDDISDFDGTESNILLGADSVADTVKNLDDDLKKEIDFASNTNIDLSNDVTNNSDDFLSQFDDLNTDFSSDNLDNVDNISNDSLNSDDLNDSLDVTKTSTMISETTENSDISAKPIFDTDKEAVNREIIKQESLISVTDEFNAFDPNLDDSKLDELNSSLDSNALNDGLDKGIDNSLDDGLNIDSPDKDSEDGSPRGYTPKPKKKKSGKSAKLVKFLVFILLLLMVVVAFSFFFNNDSNKPLADAEPKAPVANQSELKVQPKPQPVSKIEPPVTSNIAESTNVEKSDKADELKPDEATKADASKPEKIELAATKDSKKLNGEKVPAESTKSEKTPKVNVNQIDAKGIVNAKIPEQEALMKEEIDRLKDQDEQFKEQTELLDQRVEMMDVLTMRKEEQIKLLEKQIAQLEKSQKDK